MPQISIIAAIGLHNEIGFNNQLLCRLPADMAHFKMLTDGHAIVMGRRTWESLSLRPLPHRHNIVLSKNPAFSLPDATVIHSPSELSEVTDNQEEIFIIGGEQIYRLFIENSQTLYLTRIMAEFPADAFFPIIDEKKWHLAEETFHTKDAENPYNMKFQKWVRTA